MTLATRLCTLISGRYIGKDVFGNRYYESRRPQANGHNRRWVIYAKADEPSMVPAAWHGWLHYMVDASPESLSAKTYPWQKQHRPNLTGTRAAYRPKGHPLNGGKRARATGDYDAWKP